MQEVESGESEVLTFMRECMASDDFRSAKKNDHLVPAIKELFALVDAKPGSMGDTAAYEKGFDDGEKSTDTVLTASPATVRLYINCAPSEPATSLTASLYAWSKELAERAGVADIRLAGNDGPMGYGKWRGAWAAMVREHGAELEPGAYVMNTGDELSNEAAAALRSVVDLYVQG